VLASLDHPNIVHAYAEGKFRGQRYAVLEYVDGTNLKDRILRTDPLLVVYRRQLLCGMAAALAHVHERGFLQLDFKPENVLVPRTYEPKLIDFDLAVTRPSVPRRFSSVAGTVAYLAPEQIAGEPVDERADIFAFGITAYEMITGKKPVTANTREEMLAKYTSFNEHLVPLRSRAPDLPAAIERVILKCLEMDVERRYPLMSLVVRDLQA
jgi:serine/threonine-protein kinase